MTTPPITDPTQSITADDPRVAQVLALIRSRQQAVQPVPSAPLTAQVQPVPVPAPAMPQASPLQQQVQQQQSTQQLPAPPQSNLPPMSGPAPNLPPETPPQVQQGPGPVKSFLQSLVSSLGSTAYAGTQGALQKLGIPTDYEKQQNALKIGLQQQQQNSLEGLRNAQQGLYEGKGAQLDQMMAPYTIAANDASVLPQLRGQPTTFGGYQAMQKISAATQGKEDVATINQQGGAVPISPEFAARIGHPELAGTTLPAKAIASFGKQLSGEGSGISIADVGGRSVLFDKTQVNSPNKGIVQDLGPSTKLLTAQMYANNRTVQVVNPNDPNSTVQMSPGQANALGAQGTQSVGYQANKAVTRYFTSGAGAQNLNAFNTATAHLQQLGVVADALGNGDTQLFNKVGQDFAQQTGQTAPTNFDAVKTAVAGEIGKVFKGGNATDQEISEMNATINRTQSPQQLKGVIQTYTALMNSKRESLQNQYVQGKKGQPNFPGSSEAPSSGNHPFFSQFGGQAGSK